MMKRWVWVWAVVLSGSVFAQSSSLLPNIGIDRLVLTPGRGPVIGGDAQTMGQWGVRAGIAIHYERAPLVVAIQQNGQTTLGEVIPHRLQLHAFGAIGLLEWLDVQVQAPFTVWQAPTDWPMLNVHPANGGVGSPVLGVRARILSQAGGSPIDLAVQLSGSIPLGTPDALTGGRLALLPQVHAGRSFFERLHVFAMVGGSLEPTVGNTNESLGSQIEFIAHAEYGEFIRVGLTSRSVFSFIRPEPITELLFSLRSGRVGPVDFFAQGGPTFGISPGEPAFRVLAGLALSTAPLEKPQPKKELLPPEPPNPDADGDQIATAVDRCPDSFGFAEFNGCPAPDLDQDGLGDLDDQCPDQAGPRELNGCPNVDRDADGVKDDADRCVDVAGIAELQGCPVADADADQVPDHLDHCPSEPGVASNQGCPLAKKLLVVITTEKLDLKDKVYFATGTSQVLARSNALLDEVAGVLLDHPQMKVAIEGHTDDVGSPEKNNALSAARAASVRAALVWRGIPADRLSAAGFGSQRPAVPNNSAANRSQNRRVEFILAADDQVSTGGTP